MEQGTYRRAVLLSDEELSIIVSCLMEIWLDHPHSPDAQHIEALARRLVKEHPPACNGTDLCP